MKRYFVNGKEITEAEAKEITENNNKYMASNDFNEMLKIKFIVVI
jgi:hypothetical protein